MVLGLFLKMIFLALLSRMHLFINLFFGGGGGSFFSSSIGILAEINCH